MDSFINSPQRLHITNQTHPNTIHIRYKLLYSNNLPHAGIFLGDEIRQLTSTQPAPPAEAGDWPLTWRINLEGDFRNFQVQRKIQKRF